MNWTEFFHMGGYAFHVWTSWGLTLLVIVFLFIQTKLANAKIKREIVRQIQREQKLADNTANSTNSN